MRCLDDTAAGIRGFPLRLWFSSCLCLLVPFDARKKTELSTNSSLHGCFHDCKADGALFSALPAPPSGLRAAPRGQSAAIALFAGFFRPFWDGVFAVFCARRKRPAHQTEKNEPHFCGPQQFPPRRGANIYDPLRRVLLPIRQTALARPFARRRASTLRPFAVDMRLRKPCSLER